MSADDGERLLDRARQRIARALLGGTSETGARLGELVLRPHQASAVGRLLEIIATYRGALLADAVGLGKTYVALAVAREHASSFVICPAALRSMWQRATHLAGLDIPIASIESLSRGLDPPCKPELIIVDEAHHLRTPGTRRYEAIAHLAHRARVLLVSATPVHNSRRDLTALLALFAGSRVKDWSDAGLSRLVVRRDESASDQQLPPVVGPEPLFPGGDDDCLDAILAVPPAVPAADEGVAHALATISLLHLWTSSRAALVASIRKRIARAIALRAALATGHVPTAAELSAWRFADDSLQLAFPFFAVNDSVDIDIEALVDRLDRYGEAAAALVESCRREPDPDAARVDLLQALRRRHPGERIVAFSQYAHTVTALGRRMRAEPGVAIVTADGARIASGPLRREEILAQFAVDAAPVRPVQRIDLMLTTDLLSEGIDLRGASVIVHLDLPWNPARMEQRVGRARRSGSPHQQIHVYTFVPPTAAERMLELGRRLCGKVNAAQALLGGAFHPFGSAALETTSPVSAGEALRSHVRQWLSVDIDDGEEGPIVGAAAGAVDGWIAVVIIAGLPRAIASSDGRIADDASLCLQLLESLRGAAGVDARRRDDVLHEIRDWVAAREATTTVGSCATAKRVVLERLSLTVARAPRHRRPAAIATARRTRAALAGVDGVGIERVLTALARSTAGDDAWLEAVASFSALHAADPPPGAEARDPIVAVILVERVSSADDATPG